MGCSRKKDQSTQSITNQQGGALAGIARRMVTDRQ